ncbi:MAG: hypothetical protein L3J39_12995 [Verrucomicrobiales bacterium]|nr:hypothetical protein [Verrucomicrobiales bacterium]
MSFILASLAQEIAPLGDVEYLYLLLEPIFIYGITLGVISAIIAYFINSTPFQILSLSLIAISALVIFPYLSLREKSQLRIEQVYKIDQPKRATQFQEITQNRQAHRWLYLIVAITGGFAVIIGPRRNRLGLIFAIVCIGFSVKTVIYSLTMHHQDCLLSQPHLQKNQSPVQRRVKEQSTKQKS